MRACGFQPHSIKSPRTYCVPNDVFVHVLILSLCSLLLHGPQPASSVLVSDLFPFGASAGDSSTARLDDGGSGEIKLAIMFPFFGKRHNKCYVNNNGVISFVAELQTYTPENFPLTQSTPILAPFWADVNIDNATGSVWYRETRQQALLTKATLEIRAFSAYPNFRANWVFIATWDGVGFYGADKDGLTKKNTFQAVLVLDTTRQQSFVILNYAKIVWTTGTNSQGDPSTGLGGTPAQAGFNAGDQIRCYEIEGARSPSVINLTFISNVGIPGKWIFQIDTAEIQDVCSKLGSGTVTFQPPFASMLGGDSITVIGMCFDSEVPPLKGRLETEEGAIEELCCFVENVSAKCYIPSLFHTGFVNVSLNVNEAGWTYSGQLEIENIMDITLDVTRINPDNWLTGNTVFVSWSIDFFEQATSYKFDVLAFKMTNGQPSLQSVYNVTHTRNDLKTYSINLPKTFSGAFIAVVRVTALPNNCSSNLAGPSIHSDVFPVRYAEVSHSQTMCTNWLSEQSKLETLAVTGHCPCTQSQAEGDTAQYTQDPFCSLNSGWLSNCKYRSNDASYCILPNQKSENNGTYVCCYDKNTGELLIALDGHGGGTKERYDFRQSSQNVIPYFTYMQEEIAPYMNCCEFSQNNTLCNIYLKVRQPVDCRGYQPPAAAQAAGDPHIVTLDGCPFTFNGVGVYTLLSVKNTEATIQVRAMPVTDENNKPQNATVFTAVAMKASNSSSVLEIRLAMPGEQDLISIYQDSEPFSLGTSTSQLSEMIVYKNPSQNGTTELTVVMERIGLSVMLQATEDMLNIMVMAGSTLKNQLEGLLGNYNGDKSDDLTAKDGTVLDINASMRDIHYIFGMSWYVSDNESLFTQTRTTDFDMSIDEETTVSPQSDYYIPVFLDEIQSVVVPNDTEEVCGENTECQFDYMVSGKKSIAVAMLMFSELFEERLKDVSQVVRCPYFSASGIENGSRNLTGLQVGASITVTCDDGFHISGSDHLFCEATGEWNTSPPSCVKLIPDDSLPVSIAAGAAAGGFVLIVAIIVITKLAYKRCSEGKLSKYERSQIGSDMDHATELPGIFPISDIPSPVFDNSLFISSLYKLSEKGSFRIPRPTFVDPNIYSEYF